MPFAPPSIPPSLVFPPFLALPVPLPSWLTPIRLRLPPLLGPGQANLRIRTRVTSQFVALPFRVSTATDDGSRFAFSGMVAGTNSTDVVRRVLAAAHAKSKGRLHTVTLDRGVENTPHKGWMAKRGITPAWAPVGVSQKNPVAERMNGTLLDSARTLRLASPLPENVLTTEASFVSAVQAHNLTVHPKLGGLSPHEVLLGCTPPKYYPLGTLAWATVARDGAEKLQPRAKRVVVLHRDHDHGYVFPRAGFVVMDWSADGRPASDPYVVSKIHDPVLPAVPSSITQPVSGLLSNLLHPASSDSCGDVKDVGAVHVDDIVDVSALLPAAVEQPSYDTSRTARKRERRKLQLQQRASALSSSSSSSVANASSSTSTLRRSARSRKATAHPSGVLVRWRRG